MITMIIMVGLVVVVVDYVYYRDTTMGERERVVKVRVVVVVFGLARLSPTVLVHEYS